MHYLSRYPKTIKEAGDVLRKKWFAREEIEETIPKLIQHGYLNDLQYATAYLNSEVSRKGKPLLLIKQKLLMKGIEKQLIEACIETMEEDLQVGQAEKIAKEIARLRGKGKADPEIVQALIKRGFSYQTLREQLSENEE
jgi:regulatory protein